MSISWFLHIPRSLPRGGCLKLQTEHCSSLSQAPSSYLISSSSLSLPSSQSSLSLSPVLPLARRLPDAGAVLDPLPVGLSGGPHLGEDAGHVLAGLRVQPHLLGRDVRRPEPQSCAPLQTHHAIVHCQYIFNGC